MKVITVMGSPKKDGKTATTLGMFENNMLSQGHEVKRINITDYKINGCLGCFQCMSKTDEPGCVQEDDALLIFDNMFAADVIVYASPLYSLSYTAQVKPFIDRHLCLIKTKLLDEKSTALLITCAGPAERADLLQETFRRSFGGDGVVPTHLVGEFIVPLSSAPDFSERSKEVADMMTSVILNNFVEDKSSTPKKNAYKIYT